MNDPFKLVEKHLIRLKKLNERLNQASDSYTRKSFANELKREADIVGKAVQKVHRTERRLAASCRILQADTHQ